MLVLQFRKVLEERNSGKDKEETQDKEAETVAEEAPVEETPVEEAVAEEAPARRNCC